METRNNVNSIKQKIVSGVFLTIFVLAFIFACLKNVLPIGGWIVGTFGALTYPMLIVLFLVSLAGFLGFSYTRSMKATTYFALSLLSVLLFIQALSTFSKLNAVVNGKTLADYLAYSYQKTTLIGSAGSIVCGLISLCLGAMGVVIVSVIMATICIGLFIDYQLYGKYEKPHVKKLKTKAVREKVAKSDRKKTADGEPVYSYNENEQEVVGEIFAGEEYTSNQTQTSSVPEYTNDDIVGEITNEDISIGYQPTESYTSDDLYGTSSGIYQENTNSGESGFSGLYSSSSYPTSYDSDKDASRREFMSHTFGGFDSSQNDTITNNVSVDDSTIQEPAFEPFAETKTEENEDNSSSFGFGSGLFADNDEDDALSQILKSNTDDTLKDDDLSFGTNLGMNIEEPVVQNTGFDNPSPASIYNQPEPQPTFRPEPQPLNTGFNDGSLEKRNAGFNFKPPAAKEYEKPELKISSTHPMMNEQPKEKVVIPPKPIARNPYGVNMGMPGVKYNPPPLSLLSQPKPDTGDYSAEQAKKSAILEQVLEAFNVPVKVANIVRGPKITRYELDVPYGVSVDKIPRHENDIARALCAKTITIKAPIPGTRFAGIEIENDTFTSVCLRELLESKAFQNCKDPLPVVIGKDISGEIVVKSLAKMVHLLVAGSTGSGKSVFVHNMILSLIFKYSPDDLRFMLIDPKKVEFNIYNGLPHLLTPEVVLGADKALNALKWCVKEMDRRYDLMSKAGYNNIEPYNKSDIVKSGQFEKMPYIVIVIDEFAEVMVANKKEAEVCVQRITQLARACGMHLIIATQRPSVDVITGVIKNNIPSRVALSLQSGIDSKTILNTVGAEKLLGQGDMIFAPTGTSAWPRLQGAYATDEEIRAIIDYDIKYNTASFDESVMTAMDAEQTPPDSVGGSGGSVFVDSAPNKETMDPYFKIAVKHVMMNGGASVSYLQRRLSIGYSRAARIVDVMEDKGFIAPATGAKLRKVLITPEQFREEFGEDYDSLD